jgi:BASS family bile acid:Na+ symporter
MTETLLWTQSISIFVFTVSSMLSVGLGYSVREILEPLRDWQALARALVANFVLVPILAFVILRLVPLEPGWQIGLVLLASAAGAPFLIKLTQAAKGPLALSATLLVILVPITVVFMPLFVPAVVPEANVSAGAIARQLSMTLLVPLVIGLFIHSRASGFALRARPIFGRLSTIALILLLAAIVLLNLPTIVDMVRSLAIVAVLLFIVGAFAIGYLVARPGRGRRTVLALGTAQRNVAAATLVASQNIADEGALVMVTFISVIEMAVLFPLAGWLRKRSTRGVSAPPDTRFAGARG